MMRCKTYKDGINTAAIQNKFYSSTRNQMVTQNEQGLTSSIHISVMFVRRFSSNRMSRSKIRGWWGRRFRDTTGSVRG